MISKSLEENLTLFVCFNSMHDFDLVLGLRGSITEMKVEDSRSEPTRQYLNLKGKKHEICNPC